MALASEQEINMYNDIISKGCCKRCALRYMGFDKTLISFDFPNTSLVNFGILSPLEEFEPEPLTKLKKINPCSVCLGVLQDPIIEEMLAHENLSKTYEYLSTNFVPYITFPTCVLVRDRSMKIYLKRTFPETFDGSKVIKINHAWRHSVENKLTQILKKTYHCSSKFTLHFSTEYLLDEEEMATVQEHIYVPHALSRQNVKILLESKSDEEFGTLVKVPPRVPFYGVELKELKYFSEAVHLMGNYCKYSRDLPQLPVVVDGQTTSKSSVHEIIVNGIKTFNSFKDSVFKASSFDDPCMRILGDGKTFHLQLNDPQFESLSRRQCRQIEKCINGSKVMSVQNLREADKRDIAVDMDSEQISPRSYKVLCIVYKCKNIDHCINAINMYSTLHVQQKTPLRMLHLRSHVMTKKKKIYHIRAKKVKDNLLELDLCAQSGFYLPEFGHGDFGRTCPSLSDIMRAKVEVLTIDIVQFQSTLSCAADEQDVVI